jgi:hypothetical protein
VVAVVSGRGAASFQVVYTDQLVQYKNGIPIHDSRQVVVGWCALFLQCRRNDVLVSKARDGFFVGQAHCEEGSEVEEGKDFRHHVALFSKE